MGERRGTKALELWCKRMTDGYPGVKIDNMTTSWRDGLAFCAMIHHFRPELIDFDKLNKNDVYFNNDLAFRTAETHLGIPALLDADDMATYEVPDRLSILTYLSQFYQVFAAQESHNRLKRTSAAAEKTQISKTQGPPPKMAHVVGVPKRDPCQKCSLPVFLAERLTFGKHVYHRTCLKCARCNAQLSLGSFYETEVDGEYCCETCPDEEELSTLQTATNQMEDDLIGAVAINAPHSSIADRLAYFETIKESGNALLQKSVSDEEKRQSLNKFNESSTSYKMNTALSNFMSSTINDEEVHDSITSIQDIISSTASTSSSDDDENSEKLSAPKLPKTLPPQQLQSESQSDLDSNDFDKNISDIDIDDEQQQPLDAQSPRLSLYNTKIVNNEINPIIPNKIDTDTDADADAINQSLPSEQPLPEQKISNSNNYKTSVVLSLASSPAKNDLKLNENNDNNIVTKDTSENDETTPTKINEINNPSNIVERHDELSQINDDKKTNDSVVLRDSITTDAHQSTIDENYDIDDVTTNRLSVVRARLHQFEVITNNSADNINKNNNRLSGNSSSNCKIDNPKISYENKENINKNNEIESEKDLIADQNPINQSNEIPDNNEIVVEASAIDKVPKLNESSDLSNFNKTNESIDTKHKSDNDESNIVTDALDGDKIHQSLTSEIETIKKTDIIYPDDLNPFNDDEENVEVETVKTAVVPAPRKTVPEIVSPSKSPSGGNDLNRSLNPFDSSDDEIELNKKVKPPRPPPPKNVPKNPFGSDTDEADETQSASNVSKNLSKRTPVPTPRIITASQTPTPEPTPRMSTKQFNATTPLNNTGEYYGSSASLGSPYTPSLRRDSDARGSINSLTSSNGTIRSRKSKKAPAPPPPSSTSVKELFPSPETANSSRKSTPNSSTSTTPSQTRKKRPAPAPPKPARLDPNSSLTNPDISSKNLHSYPLQSNIDKLSDEEKALLEGKVFSLEDHNNDQNQEQLSNSRRLIPLDTRIIDDDDHELSDIHHTEPCNVTYRRKIFPSLMNSPTDPEKSIVSHDRQLQKLKDNKEAQNRNRQSQVSLGGGDDVDPLFNNKSSHGKWKRRKGPAPSLPIPPRKILQMLPLQEIRYELDIIEVQQQGLEKQGVVLEQMIRDRCEGKNGELNSNSTPNSKEVEDLILQLFELVNEKNELFRRQAELMYLRRQHRLEQEQADLEYEIRVLMAQPERNKTDTDKAREEALIARMVEVVQLRNEVIECLEMDRLREAEEDLSIKQRLELHTARRESEPSSDSTKLSKKEKKKQKETKKLFKSKKLDVDKDDDESELNVDKLKTKKKKKKFLF